MTIEEEIGTNKITIELECPKKGQIFTHEDTRTGEKTTFIIDLMQDTAKKYGGKCSEILAQKAPLTKYVTDFARKNFGIEPARLDRLKEPYLFEPILVVWLPDDNEVLCVDGHHRMVKLFELGYVTVNCYIFMFPFWKNFTANVVLPDDYMTKDSGVLDWEKERDKK